MKVYTGHRLSPGHVTVWVINDQDPQDTHALKHNPYHSPDGFEWGYGGSGPAELAKDLLWDFEDRMPGASLYQAFKQRFIAPITEDDWAINGDEVERFLVEVRGTEG
jgi:hypothetical protein